MPVYDLLELGPALNEIRPNELCLIGEKVLHGKAEASHLGTVEGTRCLRLREYESNLQKAIQVPKSPLWEVRSD
jgi:hypothetical protein